MITIRKTAAMAAVILTAAAALAACDGDVSKAPVRSTPVVPAASPSPSQPLTGPIGTSFEMTGLAVAANGATAGYSVRLIQVEQNATLGPSGTLTNGSDHVAAAQFTITGKTGGPTGQASDDVDTAAVVVGSDSQDYTPSPDPVTAGTNFAGGAFNVSPGQTVTGWVAFELPAGVSVASVQWSAGLGGQTATWTIK